MASRLLTLGIPGGSKGVIRNGLIAYYKFNEGSGQVLRDYSGKGYNGQLGSTAGADASDPTWSSQGLTYTATKYVSAPAIPLTTATTIFTVYKTTSNIDNSGVFMGQDAVTYNYLVYYNKSGTQVFYVRTASGLSTASKSGISLDTWYLAVCRYDSSAPSGRIRVQVNGVWGTAVNGYGEPLLSTTTTSIGSAGAGTGGLVGTMPFACVYNRALSDTEINYNNKIIKKMMAKRGIIIT